MYRLLEFKQLYNIRIQLSAVLKLGWFQSGHEQTVPERVILNVMDHTTSPAKTPDLYECLPHFNPFSCCACD